MKPTIFMLLFGSLLLSACGGGSGGGDDSEENAPLELSSSIFYRLTTGIFTTTNAEAKNLLTADFNSGDRILNFSISPDGRWIALNARLNGDTQYHMYLLPISGGTANKISTFNNTFADAFSFSWSPDSNRIVYNADDTFDGRFELFMVTINSDDTFNAAQKVSGPIGASNSIGNPEWSFDGSHLAYTVSESSTGFSIIGINTHEVGTQSGDTNFSIRVSKPSFDNSGFGFAWSPIENKLMYRAAVQSSTSEAFWVNASEDEGTYVASDRVVSVLTGSEEVTGFKWSDDGRYLAYFVTDISEHSIKIFDDDATTANDLLLLDNVNLNGASDGSRAFEWLPGENRIVGFHFDSTSSNHQLTTINADGSNRADTTIASASVQFLIASNNSSIAILDQNITGLESRLFFVATDSATVVHSFDFPTDRISIGFGTSNWSPDNSKFVYIQNNLASNTSQVHRIDLSNGSQVMISANGENSRAPLWSPDSAYICHSKITELSPSPVIQERELICSTSDGSNSDNFTENINEESTLQFTFDGIVTQSDST